MTLGDLIEFLADEDQDRVLVLGFSNPHSYRGYYDQLAFEPEENVTIASMLECAKAADGATYEGWKGGDFLMREFTDCWIAPVGECGEALGEMLLTYMVNDEGAKA